MKTKSIHSVIIIGSIIILLTPLVLISIIFFFSYLEYKSCKSFEDYRILCSKQEQKGGLLNYNLFYSKALLKREELHSSYIADSIAAAEEAAAEASEEYNIQNTENDYIIELIRNATYYNYYNSRFNFQLSYPSFLIAEDEPDNGDGRRFSINSEIVLSVSGINNVSNESIESKYYENDVQSAAYSTLKENWYIISDYSTDGRIFYQKTVLYNDAFITAILYFPPKYKNEFDTIIKRIFTKFPN